MRTIKLVTLAAAVALALLLPMGAYAANTTCTNAVAITPDGTPHTGSFTAANQERWFSFTARPNRSYSIMIENLSATDVQFFVQLDEAAITLGDCTTLAGFSAFSTPENTEPESEGDGGADRINIVSTTTQVYHFNLEGSAGSFSVRVVETTLFNPRWSTFGGFSTQWGLHNTTNGTRTVTLRVINSAGAVVATDTFTVSAGRVVFKTTAGLGIAANQAGNAIATHDGPPGAIQADTFLVSGDLTVVVPTKFDTRSPQK